MSDYPQMLRSRAALLLAAFSLLVVSFAMVQGSGRHAAEGLDEARRLEMHGDLAGANVIYRGLLAADSTSVEAARGLGLNLALLGRFDEALPYQQTAVRLDPSDAQTWIELAFNYLNHQSEPEQGLRSMREGARLDPSPRNRTFLAQALAINGKASSAKAELEAVIVEYPDYAYARIVLQRGLERTSGSSNATTTSRMGMYGVSAGNAGVSGEAPVL